MTKFGVTTARVSTALGPYKAVEALGLREDVKRKFSDLHSKNQISTKVIEHLLSIATVMCLSSIQSGLRTNSSFHNTRNCNNF